MSRPQLSAYPHLHNILRNDPRANTDFNAYVSAIKSPPSDGRTQLENSLESERKLRDEHAAESKQLALRLKNLIRFIRFLGDIVEPQTNLTPYTQDVSEKKQYEIKLSADQIRLLLKYYWDSIGEEVEKTLARHADPAADRDVEI